MKIHEMRQARAALIGEARAIVNTAEAANRDLTTEERTAYDGKLSQVEEMKGRIEREERQSALDAQLAQPLAGQPAPKGDKVRSFDFFDYVRAIGGSHINRRDPISYAAENMGNPDLSRALAASVAASGGFAVPTILANEFIEFLRPKSVVRAAGPRILPMTNGNLSLPRITGGAVATWLGENTNITATQQTFGQVKLIAKKLAALLPISNDLLRYANPNTDATLRADLIAAMAQGEDLAFLRGDGTAFTPRGIRNWAAVANFITMNATVDIPHITSDLGSAMAYLRQANVQLDGQTGAWFFSPRTFTYLQTLRNPTTTVYAFPDMQGTTPTLFGYRVFSTSQIPVNLGATANLSEFYFVNMADCVIGETANLILDASNEATYVDSNGATISAFAQDQTVIRCIEETDFALRHDLAAAVVTGVSY